MEQHIFGKTVAERINNRMQWIQQSATDTVAGTLHLKLLCWQEETGEYVFRSATADWMRNVIGTLHGGSCAVMVVYFIKHLPQLFQLLELLLLQLMIL